MPSDVQINRYDALAAIAKTHNPPLTTLPLSHFHLAHQPATMRAEIPATAFQLDINFSPTAATSAGGASTTCECERLCRQQHHDLVNTN